MKRFARLKLVLICLLASLPMLGAAAEPVILRVDFARSNGVFRAFQGVNKGPMAAGGTIDLTASWRELGVPSTRLHDCQWPYPDVVDMHAIFRNEEADRSSTSPLSASHQGQPAPSCTRNAPHFSGLPKSTVISGFWPLFQHKA